MGEGDRMTDGLFHFMTQLLELSQAREGFAFPVDTDGDVEFFHRVGGGETVGNNGGDSWQRGGN